MWAGAANAENSTEVPQKTTRPELPHDPATSLLGMYADEIIAQKDTARPRPRPALKAALCATARGTDKADVVHVCDGHCSALGLEKSEPTPSAAMWPQLQVTRPSEARKKKTDTVRYHLHVESKIWHKWTYLQERNRLAEHTPAVAKGNRGGEGSERWAGAAVIHRTDKEQGQMVQHRNYNQYTVMGKNVRKNVRICVIELLCCMAEINNIADQPYFNKKLKQKKAI